MPAVNIPEKILENPGKKTVKKWKKSQKNPRKNPGRIPEKIPVKSRKRSQKKSWGKSRKNPGKNPVKKSHCTLYTVGGRSEQLWRRGQETDTQDRYIHILYLTDPGHRPVSVKSKRA